MKNLSKFGCLLLALAMLLTSTVALAEVVGADDLVMQTITLSDIQLSVNDTSLMDFSGLSISMGGAMDPETGKGAAQLSVLGGDESAASVMAALGDGKAVLNVDGLSKPLTLDVAELLEQLFSDENMEALLEELLGSLSEEEAAALMELGEALAECFEEENLNATAEGFDEYMATVNEIMESCLSEGTSETHEFELAGEAAAEHFTITVTEAEFVQLLTAAGKFYDSNPAFIKVINAINKLSGSDVEWSSFESLYDEANLEDWAMGMNMDVYVSDDGANEEIIGDLTVSDTQVCTYKVLVNAADESNVVVDVTVSVDDTEFYYNFSIVPSEEFEGEVELSSYVSVEDVTISVWFGPDATYGYMGTLNATAGDASFGAAFADSDTQKIFTIYDDTTSFEMGYVTEYEGAEAGEGMVYITMTENDDSYSLTAAVHTTTTTISTAEIDEMLAAEGIDVMTISDEDVSTLINELTTVGFEAVGVLGQNVPGLAQLLGTGAIGE